MRFRTTLTLALAGAVTFGLAQAAFAGDGSADVLNDLPRGTVEDLVGSRPSGLLSSPNVTIENGSTAASLDVARGLIASIDPATGDKRQPTHEQLEELEAYFQLFLRKRDTKAPLYGFESADGGYTLLLDSRYLVSERVDREADGTLQYDATEPAALSTAVATEAEEVKP